MAVTMHADDLIESLEQIALLLELQGANLFKTKAYKNGAESLRNFHGDVLKLALSNQLAEIPGIGANLQEKLHELATTGKMAYHEELKSSFPSTLFELFELQGLGPKKIKALYDTLKIDSISALKLACTDGRVGQLSGFGTKTVTNIIAAIELRETYADYFRLGDVAVLAEIILQQLRDHPAVHQCTHAGSYRRAKEILHDLDFLVATDKPAEITKFFTELPEVHSIISCGNTKAQIRLDNGLQCDLRAVSNTQYPFALQYFSGSKEHNIAIRRLALKQGWSLNEYEFTAKDGAKTPPAITPPTIHSEEDIYRALGLDYIPPELRENRGEIEAAERGEIPRLVEIGQLKGTFHNHTTASDGKHTLTEMAGAAIDLGLEYLGISDHSKSSFQANGLYPERLLKQIEEIRKLNQTWNDFQLLAGSEVDILKDGSLDFEDHILEQLDYVVASVHNAFTLPKKEMTQRIIRAMENPHVTMLGHMTGRLLLRRKPYEIDHEMIIDCAAQTGTIIELNANPRRLDMDWRWWKKARDKGVLCSINPDAHRAEHLQFLALGTRVARKGWLRKEDVFNTKSLSEIKEYLHID